jgi:peptidoglycan/xylan/chitin deacetylase (PgdA/CDA1 family)
MSLSERDLAVSRLADWSRLDLTPRESHRAMTGAEVRRLVAYSGCVVGAHTVHHLRLPAQPPETQWREILESKVALEWCLGDPVTAFAYPYGAFDDTTVAAARRGGFTAAATVQPACVERGTDPMLLPRHEVKVLAGDRFADWLSVLLDGPRG